MESSPTQEINLEKMSTVCIKDNFLNNNLIRALDRVLKLSNLPN